MATVKSFTSLEQSKKLAEILPIESADMHYIKHPIEKYYSPIPLIGKYSKIQDEMPCWSLAALLDILPKGTDIIKEEADTENEEYMCTVGVKYNIISTFGNNPIDACYDMIIKLHEMNLL